MGFDYSQHPGRRRLDRNLIHDGPPLVSVITPFYNAGNHFRETANSVLNQSFPYFEWIILDDGSTNPEHLHLLENIAGEDPRIRLIHKDNGGLASARNAAVQAARTEIIVPLDADDLIEPTYVECIYWSLQCNPGASWSYTDSVGFGELEYLWKKSFSAKTMKRENILVYSAGIRKKVLQEAGGYGELMKYYNEDWNLWLKLLSLGKYPVHLSWYGFWYRRSSGGMLSLVQRDVAIKKKNRQIIQAAGRSVKTNVNAIEFPLSRISDFQQPMKWEWARRPMLGNKKIKILMLIPHMVVGGADVFNLDIASRLDKSKFEISMIMTVREDSVWRQKFEEYATDLFDLTTFIEKKDWSAFIHYFIQSRGIDIVFIANSYYGYNLVPWLRKEFPELPIVDYVHSAVRSWRGGGYARTSGAVGDVLDKTYVCNEFLRQEMIRDFHRASADVETIYIGVDEEKFDPQKKQRGAIRKELGLSAEQPLVLFPCRICEEKRPFLMVRIAEACNKKIPGICFVAVGDGPLYAALRSDIKKRNLEQTIRLVGRREDIYSYYRDSDITLVCSAIEGLSLTSYESLAMGVPVVTADVGGQKELIDASVGRVIPAVGNEAESLQRYDGEAAEIERYVQGISDLLAERSRNNEMAKRCRNKIIHGFTKNDMIRRLEQEFTEIAEGRGKEKRRQIAQALSLIPNLATDYFAIYLQNEQWNSEMQWLLNVMQRRKSLSTIYHDLRVYGISRIFKTFFSMLKSLRGHGSV